MTENVSSIQKKKVYAPSKYRMGLPSSACPGCGSPIACNIIMDSLEELGVIENSIVVIGVGCTGMGFFGTKVDMTFCAHGPAPSVAAGIKSGRFDESIVFTIQGDGDCAAIGAGYLVNSAVRGDKITIIMCNNATYGTTGGQMAPTSLIGQVTTTTPEGRVGAKQGYPLHVPEMIAPMKGVAYSARGSVNTFANYQRTKKYIKKAFQKQIDGVGLSFVEVLTACPVNWHMTPVDAMKWIGEKMILEYPLGEFKNVDVIE